MYINMYILIPSARVWLRGVSVTVVVRVQGQAGMTRLELVPGSGTVELVVNADSPYLRYAIYVRIYRSLL